MADGPLVPAQREGGAGGGVDVEKSGSCKVVAGYVWVREGGGRDIDVAEIVGGPGCKGGLERGERGVEARVDFGGVGRGCYVSYAGVSIDEGREEERYQATEEEMSGASRFKWHLGRLWSERLSEKWMWQRTRAYERRYSAI